MDTAQMFQSLQLMLRYIATVTAAYFDLIFLLKISVLKLLAEKEAVSKLRISTGSKKFLTDLFVKLHPSNFIRLALKRGLE